MSDHYVQFKTYIKIFKLSTKSFALAKTQAHFLFSYMKKYTPDNTYCSFKLYWSGRWDYQHLTKYNQVSLIQQFNNQQDTASNVILKLTEFQNVYEPFLYEGTQELDILSLYIKIEIPYDPYIKLARYLKRVFRRWDKLYDVPNILMLSNNWIKLNIILISWLSLNKDKIRGYIEWKKNNFEPINIHNLNRMVNQKILIIKENFTILNKNLFIDQSGRTDEASNKHIKNVRRGRPKLTNRQKFDKLQRLRSDLEYKFNQLPELDPTYLTYAGRGRPRLSSRQKIYNQIIKLTQKINDLAIILKYNEFEYFGKSDINVLNKEVYNKTEVIKIKIFIYLGIYLIYKRHI